MACGHTAIRQSCIIFIYNGVPPTYDTSPKMLLVKIWPKQCCFFVSAKFYWKTIWNTLAHFLALWTMNMTNLDSFDFALYCISGALWFGTSRRLSSNYDTKIFWHIFSRKQKRESGSDREVLFHCFFLPRVLHGNQELTVARKHYMALYDD